MLQLPDGPIQRWDELALPAGCTALVLAPHPDDFDAIAVTLRRLHDAGHMLYLAVLTTGASGVQDGYMGARTPADKAALREAEQRASCARFGLAVDRISFLRLWGRDGGDADGGDVAAADGADDPPEALRQYLTARRADLVFMPHGNDPNATHRRSFEAYCAIARAERLTALALLNRDAKTIHMRSDLCTEFDEETAAWKAGLLRLHDSQQSRNLRTRGTGFDERVLQLNRDTAQRLGSALPYAEAFELLRVVD